MQAHSLVAASGRGHPLRRSLGLSSAPRRRSRQAVRDDGDLRLFALSFTAFFICFYTYLM